MKITAYIICWNEEEILPFMIKHYKRFCDRIVIYDNWSSDSSREIAEKEGCEVRMFGNRGELSDMAYLEVKNNCWKGDDSDWVIVCDCDEILYITEKGWALRPWTLATIFQTQGWNIYSNMMPESDLLEITTGWPDQSYSKSIIFNPKQIQEINYKPGAHRCEPTGNVIWSAETLYLLHYRCIGGFERLFNRYKLYRKRMTRENRKKGYGVHYWQERGKLKRDYDEKLSRCKPLI